MRKDISRFVLFISLAFSFLVIFLIFEYFMFVEIQIELKIPPDSNYDSLELFVDDRKIPLNLEKGRSFLRLKRGDHFFKILSEGIIILEEKVNVNGESAKIILKLPEPPRIESVECEYSEGDGVIRLKWETSSKADFYEIYRDGLKVARTKMKRFQERYNALEIHEYTIFPFYGEGKLRGIGKTFKVGPFVELAHLSLRIVPPYDVPMNELNVIMDGKKLNLSDTLLAVIRNVPVGSHDLKVKIDGHTVVEKKIKLIPGDNEEILELPDLPILDSVTAIVMEDGRKIKISWSDPSNDLYKVDRYKLMYSFDSKRISLTTTDTEVVLPSNFASEIRYIITPIFFGNLKGEPYEFLKPSKPTICTELIPKSASSNALIVPLKTCEDRKDVFFLFSIDGMDFEQVDGTNLKLNLKDGIHILKLKALDGFYQEDETTTTILVDTEPPEPPRDLRAFVDGEIMNLRWIEPESTDIKNCEIKTSEDMRVIAKKRNEITFDVSKVSGSVNVLVEYRDFVGNTSESSITVDIPRVPDLINSTVTHLGDGNDVNILLKFQNYSGDLILYLGSMEILHTTKNDVSFRLENLEYDTTYHLDARLKNEFGTSTVKRLVSFKTKLPKPRILKWDYEDGELHLKIDAVGTKFLYEIVGGSYSTKVQSESTDVTIPVKISGTYLLKIKAMTENNESLESMEVIEIGEGGS